MDVKLAPSSQPSPLELWDHQLHHEYLLKTGHGGRQREGTIVRGHKTATGRGLPGAPC